MGLLDAPPTQTSATGDSFKNWVTKYILPAQGITFDEKDLWGACCGVLHAFTSESDLSKGNRVREILYLAGETESLNPLSLNQTKTLGNRKFVTCNIKDLIDALFEAIEKFRVVLLANCLNDSNYEKQLNKIL